MQARFFRYGWQPDLPDARDHLYAAPHEVLKALPPMVDLRDKCPPVYDQGALGSCTGNAIAGAIQFNRLKQELDPDFVPSRLFIYYNERAIQGTVRVDSGAQIRNGIKTVSRQGVCPEDSWPYEPDSFTKKPSAACYRAARDCRAVAYSRLVHSLAQLKGCLASGFPFVFGFTVYESFESEEVAKTGKAAMPGPGERSVGGHAVLAVGYDDERQRFIVRNSWGTEWGDKGYFTMPYAYVTDGDLADDLWTVRLVSSPQD